MAWQERITADPKVLVGKPIIKGTRISVELVLDLLAGSWTVEQVLGEYPHLARRTSGRAWTMPASIRDREGIPEPCWVVRIGRSTTCSRMLSARLPLRPKPPPGSPRWSYDC